MSLQLEAPDTEEALGCLGRSHPCPVGDTVETDFVARVYEKISSVYDLFYVRRCMPAGSNRLGDWASVQAIGCWRSVWAPGSTHPCIRGTVR